MTDCLFCRIVAGEVPATVVRETEGTLAFRDLTPQAPTHVLVVPRDAPRRRRRRSPTPTRRWPPSCWRPASRSPGRRGSTTATAWSSTPAPTAGQTVFHVHLHVLGGRGLGWPPG